MTTPGGGFALADAFVRIRPTATGFRAEAESQIKAAMTGIDPTVKIGASTAAAQIKITGIKALLSDLTKKVYSAQLSTEDTKFQAALAKDMVLLHQINETVAKPEVDLQGAVKMEAQLLGLASQLETISTQIYTTHVRMDEGNLQGRLALLITQLTALGKKAYDVRVQAKPEAMQAIQAIITEIGVLQQKVDSFHFDLIDPAALGDAEQKFRVLDREIGTFLPAALNRARQGWLGFWGVLNRNVALFGGAFGTGILGFVAVWHILADAIIEAAAVLIPAGIAFGAFAAGAVDATQHIIDHMHALSTVTSAFGQNIAPLAQGGIRSLESAINPRVFTLFGEAVQAAQNKMGAFAQLAKGAGEVVDQLGARMERAITSSNFTVFLHNAVQDLAKVGDIIGNVFGIIGNLLKTLTKSAQYLLSAIDVLTRAVENLTALPVFQTMGRWVIGLHAFWLWVGLAVTGVYYLIPVLARLTGSLSLITQNARGFDRLKLAARDLGSNLGFVAGGTRGLVPSLRTFGANMVKVGEDTFAVAGKSKILAFALGTLRSVPVWGWVAAAAIALGALGYALITAKDATQQWGDALQQNIDKTSTWGNVTGKLTGALVSVNKQVANTLDTYRGAGHSVAALTASMGDNISASVQLSQRYRELKGFQAQFSGELNLSGFRLGEMSRKFGGLRSAMALAQAAGIKVTDMLHANKNAFAQDIEVIEGLIRGYRAAGIAGGALGNAVKAVQLVNEDQIRAVGQVTQAWQQLLGIVGGGEDTFTTFAQDMLSANKALAQTGGTSRTVVQTFDATATHATRVADAARAAHTAFSGLNAQSLQLRSTWQTSITAAQTYYNALSTQAAAASDGARGSQALYQAGLDLIRILAPAAKGSTTLRQQVYLLAQQFGIGAKQMQYLINHAGSLKQNERDLQRQNDYLAKSVSNVGKDWANMASTLNDQVKSALDAVALKSSGASYAAGKLYEALHQQGPASRDAHNWYLKLITDLHNAGLSWQQAKDYAAAYTKGIGFNASAIVAAASARAAQLNDLQGTVYLDKQVRTALDLYSGALQKNADQTQQGRTARRNLISDLYDIYQKAGLGAGAIETLISKLLKIPKSEVVKLLMTGTGHYSIQQYGGTRPGATGGGAPNQPAAAAGMRVPGTGNSDTVHALLTPGEAVVPKHLVPAVAPFLGAHGVPGFGSGGYVGYATGGFAGNGSFPQVAPAAGTFLYDAYLTFKHGMTAAMVSALRAALKTAQQAATIPNIGSIGGNVTQWIRAAMALAGAPGAWFPALAAIVAHESGGDPGIVNKTAVGGEHASGLWQMLPSTYHAYGGPDSLWFNPVIEGIAAIRYIRARYGSPFNIPGLFGGSYQGYDSGGWLPPGMSMAWNGTGSYERVVGPGEGAGLTVNVYAAAGAFVGGSSPLAVGQALGQFIMRHTQAGGRLYPIGVVPK